MPNGRFGAGRSGAPENGVKARFITSPANRRDCMQPPAAALFRPAAPLGMAYRRPGVGGAWRLGHLPPFYSAGTVQCHLPMGPYVLSAIASSVLCVWALQSRRGQCAAGGGAVHHRERLVFGDPGDGPVRWQQSGGRFRWWSAFLFSWPCCSCSAATSHCRSAQPRLKLGPEATHWGWLPWAPLACASFAVPT